MAAFRYYDKQGKPLDTLAWCKLFEDVSYRVVKQTCLGKYTISSIWLGLDHSFPFGDSKRDPIIFETMVLGGEGEEQFRYSTEMETLAQHEVLVAKYRNLAGPTCQCQRLLVGHDKGCPFKK